MMKIIRWRNIISADSDQLKENNHKAVESKSLKIYFKMNTKYVQI